VDPKTTKVADLIDGRYISLHVNDDQKDTMSIFQMNNRVALPVVDDKNVLLGIVTIDDVLWVAEEEFSEDMQKMGGTEALEEPYLEISLKGKRVYIIEDMVDTGATMLEILIRVNDKQPVDVKIVTLVHRKGNSFPVDHYCFEIGDEWVVGYGFDDMGLKRNYRNIYKK
jgi:hypoxanthine phosphoribosyltransferase